MSDVSSNIERIERLEQAYNDRDYDTVRSDRRARLRRAYTPVPR